MIRRNSGGILPSGFVAKAGALTVAIVFVGVVVVWCWVFGGALVCTYGWPQG